MPFALYLVQHGKARAESEDPSRGLTNEGRGDVARVASFLEAAGVVLDRIEHSDKLRARQTAEILAARLRPREGTREIPGIAPNDDPAPLVSRLAREAGSLMLVGHLPHLGRLVSLLVAGSPALPIVQFQMGGAIRLDRDEGGRWVVRWAVAPEIVR